MNNRKTTFNTDGAREHMQSPLRRVFASEQAVRAQEESCREMNRMRLVGNLIMPY